MLDKISSDIISAMKSRDSFTLGTLRMLKGAIQLEEINRRIKLSDEDIVGIVFKQIKMRKEGIVEFEKGNRKDLVDQNNAEIEILNKYLPIQLSDEEINIIVDDAIKVVDAKKQSDIGRIMGIVMPKLKGKADMGKVNNIIKSKLDF